VPDWRSLIKTTLENLDGGRYRVPGAVLLDALQKAALAQGQDFRAMLREERKRFGEFLQGLAPEVELQYRGQHDMLVGLKGAGERPPDPNASEVLKFRSDVYKAFTRASQRPFVYSARLDLFTQDVAEPGAVQVPQITQEELLNERREFAKTIIGPLGAVVLASLDGFNPLGSFQKVVLQNKHGRAWRAFHSASIDRRLSAWARENSLNVSPVWRGERVQSYTDREVVMQIISYMNDEEIAQMHLPARAVTIGVNAILSRAVAK